AFLLSSSLLAVMAQRLVRVLCSQCKQASPASAAECELLRVAATAPPVLFRPQGCGHCNQSGYRGRTGIYELIVIDDTLRAMIHEGAGEQAVSAYARSKVSGILDDGYRR